MFYILLILIITNINANPLSNIKITSEKATLSKLNNDIHVVYNNNVNVTLADQSKIKSDTLNVFLTNDNKSPELKEAIFEGSVLMTQKNRSIQADIVKVFPNEKICKLFGNIKVEQLKEHKNDVPITTISNQAILNLNNNKVEFLGDTTHPVQTIIKLEHYDKLQPKKIHEQNKNII